MVVSAYCSMNLSQFVSIRLLFVLLMLISGLANAASIQVTSDRNPVSLNESFQLVYKSSDSVDGDPDFSPLKKYLDVLKRSQSSNVSIVNGRYSSSKTWTLSVMARQVGTVVLPPVKFGSDLSDAYSITVKEAAKNQQDQAGFYTRISVDQEQVYAQQQLVITQQLFSNKNLSAFGMGELDFNGMDVVIQKLGEEKQYNTRIGGKTYLVIERSYAVFPQTSGLMKMSPVLAEAQVGRSSNSFFDSLGRNKVVRARSNSIDIAVLPVPKNINVNPWLPAKDFQLVEQWPQNSPKFVQGEPVTRTLSIKADGLTAAQLPVLPEISIDGLKQYPDQPLLNDITNESGVTGYRVEKVALIPTKAGIFILPAIDIPWWNSATQKREVAHIPARTINVEAPVNTETASIPLMPADKQIESVNIAPVQNEQPLEPILDKVLTVEEQPSSKLWFVLAILFALGWLVTVIAWMLASNKKNKVTGSVQTESTVNLKQAFKQLKKSCEKEDVSKCRSQLLLWARALFSTQNIQSFTDLLQFSTQEMNVEIRKIDALLYGRQSQQINFTLIIDQATLMMQQYKNNSRQSKTELLEPLYK